MSRNYYEVLGVDKHADPKEIKKAYKSLAKKYHPDISKEEDADAKFKELNEANDVLSDEEKRAHYDNVGDSRYKHEQSYGGGSSYGFGGMNINSIQWKEMSFLKKILVVIGLLCLAIFIIIGIIIWAIFKLVQMIVDAIFG